MGSNGIVVVDLDGCLTSYPGVFLDWAAREKKLSFDSLEAMKAAMPRDAYEEIKHAYRTSGIKRTLPVTAGACKALRTLKQRGMEIWIVTTRPGWEPVGSDTKFWLDSNDLRHDELIFVKDKVDFVAGNLCKGINTVIDDDFAVVDFASGAPGVRAFYFNSDHADISNEKITAVNSWKEIGDYLESHDPVLN